MAEDLNTGTGYQFNTLADVSGLHDKFTIKHDTQRFQRLKKAWEMYFGEQWEFEREDGEPLITINYLAALIDKKISFLVGNDFSLTVPKPLVNVTLPTLTNAWADSGRQRLIYEIAQEGAVTGDCFLLVTAAPPTPAQLRFDPMAKYRIVVQRLNSHECWPDFDTSAPVGPYGRPLRSFTIMKTFRRPKPGTAKNTTSAQDFEDVIYTMTITAETITEKLGDRETTRPNALGEIPVAHIPNKPSGRTLFGISDVDDLIPLQKDLNEKSTDVSDTINYNSAPVTVIIGARAKNLERGAKAVWSGLPQGATVQLLSLEGDLAAAVSYLERIKKAMHELANVPEGALGQMQAITGTSGDTLHMTMSPLIDERNKKKATYEPGFEHVNYFILRYAEVLRGLVLPKGVCAKCGGKIAITYVDHPVDVDAQGDPVQVEVRKCYLLDPETFDFLPPDKLRVPLIRQHSMGDEMTEIPLDQAEREHGSIQSSYWDPAPEEAANDEDPLTTKLPPGFQLPPEPEQFDLPEVTVEFEDGTTVTWQQARTGVFAVPIPDCTAHSYLSPYTSYVRFNDTLPKDKQAQANLFQTYDQLNIVSKAWMMEEIGIDDPARMWQDIQAETAQLTAAQTPAMPADQSVLPTDENSTTSSSGSNA